MPPGQAKYVTCVSGAVLDIVVDLRVGSPSFGQWAAVSLNDQTLPAGSMVLTLPRYEDCPT
jgi:dTDP-4-dehydrorhamnose 3,5-epimerase